MKNNKKGISAIVATVLIILITVAAVTIIWAAIIPMIQGNLASGQACLEASSQVQIKNEGYTCYVADADGDGAANEADDKYVKVQVGLGAGDITLKDLQLVVNNEGDSTSYSVVKADVFSATAAATTVANAKVFTTAPYGPSGFTAPVVGDITNATSLPGMNSNKVYYIKLTDAAAGATSVQVAPIVGVNNVEDACEVSATVELQPCQ